MWRFLKNKVGPKPRSPEKQPVIKPVPLPLFSSDHINYYSFVHGVSIGKSIKRWREAQKKRQLKRRFSSDSPGASSSATAPPGSAQSTPPKSRSSAQSSPKASTSGEKTTPVKKTTTSKKSSLNTDTKPTSQGDSAEASTQKDERPSKAKPDKTKEPTINIQVNPLSDPKFEEIVATSNKTKPKLSEGETETRTIPFDTGWEEPQPSTSFAQPEVKVYSKKLSYEPLSSTSSSSAEQFVNDKHKEPQNKDAKERINTELRYALSHSVPISSEKVYRSQRVAQDGASYSVSQEVTPRRRRSASVQLEDSPPSPAPGTPVKGNSDRRTRSCDRARSKNFITESVWSNTKPLEEKLDYGGPRVAYLRIAHQSEYSFDYEIVEPEKQNKTEPLDRKCYEFCRRTSSAQRSFAENIYSQFRYRRRRTFNKHYWLSMGKMNSMDDQERKIIIEFCHLLEKSKQLFNGLRELPQYGHKQWSMYFGRTFDIYTRLWKYQQQHRAVLDSKYGMKRWQIGEIASKIGQLYYHFYLRTSETGYLNEAYAFYYAIRGRCYYTKANKEDRCELMVKKLRYYARFIVVCLLLKKMKLVKELIKELDRQIIEYGNTYDPDDQVEWTVVVDEVKAFIHAEPVVGIIDSDNYSMIISHRLTPSNTPAVERSSQMNLTLQETLIVGSSSAQVKFSELTMDMFRMLQTLEREPVGEVQRNLDDSPRARYTSTPNAHSQDGLDPGMKLPNPHKYLLFKPTPSQILVYLASGFHDLPPSGVLLLYISADGHLPQAPKHAEDVGYDMGGLITTSKNDIYRDCSRDKIPPSAKYKEHQCLYPGDLHPFTRKPFFLIVDSDNSYAFQNIPRHFGQPMVILMSPLELPASFHDRRQQGSLFTLFLHSPLTAFCYCCDISNISLANWEGAQSIIRHFIDEASAILVRSRIDISYISFMGDDFLRLLILRYVFCEVVLRMHRAFRARSHLTRSTPPLPDELFEHPSLIQQVMKLASHLQVRSHFHDPSIASGPPTTKD